MQFGGRPLRDAPTRTLKSGRPSASWTVPSICSSWSEREVQIGSRAGLGLLETFFAQRVARRADFEDQLLGTQTFDDHESVRIGVIVAIDLSPGKSDARIRDGTIVGRLFDAHAEATSLDQPQGHRPWCFGAGDRDLLRFESLQTRNLVSRFGKEAIGAGSDVFECETARGIGAGLRRWARQGGGSCQEVDRRPRDRRSIGRFDDRAAQFLSVLVGA